jgi:membrane associated rhomboid family serine protease
MVMSIPEGPPVDDQTPPPRPWGEASPTPASEPAINAPWPSVAVVLVIVGSYAVQSLVLGADRTVAAYGFAPVQLLQGHWLGVLTMMFVHGGWVHALTNAVAALAFGPPVARLLGDDARGAAVFFGFYLVCGVLASLGYAVLHLHDAGPVVGASGAVSGLVGAATRRLGREEGLSPILSRPVLNLAGGWIVANLLLAITGASPLMPGAKVAWEAHVVGLIAGILLIGPAWKLVRGGAPQADVTGRTLPGKGD